MASCSTAGSSSGSGQASRSGISPRRCASLIPTAGIQPSSRKARSRPRSKCPRARYQGMSITSSAGGGASSGGPALATMRTRTTLTRSPSPTSATGSDMARLTNHASVLRALDLDRQNALNQAQFYLAYADMLENSSPAASAGDAWARVAHPAQKWLGQATIASACRAAAQYAALVDSSWAARLAVRTGRAYVAAG